MKLPKNFGGQGFGSMMEQMKGAMAQAQTLEVQLAEQVIVVDKTVVKATFNGLGELQKLKLDPSLLDPEDVEALEDLIVGTVRDGFEQATAMRNERVNAIMPNLPNVPGL